MNISTPTSTEQQTTDIEIRNEFFTTEQTHRLLWLLSWWLCCCSSLIRISLIILYQLEEHINKLVYRRKSFGLKAFGVFGLQTTVPPNDNNNDGCVSWFLRANQTMFGRCSLNISKRIFNYIPIEISPSNVQAIYFMGHVWRTFTFQGSFFFSSSLNCDLIAIVNHKIVKCF